jgi:hypothetical protein
MADLKYGTPEFYAELFMDILADAQGDEPQYGDAIVEGFILAIQDWRDYYSKQVNELKRIEQRVRQAPTLY